MSRRGAVLFIALAVPASAMPAHAQPSFKTVNDMARECITDDLLLDGLLLGVYSRFDRRSGKHPPRAGSRSMPSGPWIKGRRRQRVHSGDTWRTMPTKAICLHQC